MFIDDKLKQKVNDYVAAHYPAAAMFNFETLKRPPGPRLFLCLYDNDLKLIKEIEILEVMEWVNQDTSEKETPEVSMQIESPERPKRNARQRKGQQGNQK